VVLQVLSFLDDIFPALLTSLSDTSDEVSSAPLDGDGWLGQSLAYL
jgi:hypothetical protein